MAETEGWYLLSACEGVDNVTSAELEEIIEGVCKDAGVSYDPKRFDTSYFA